MFIYIVWMAKSSCLIFEVQILRLRHGTSILRVCQLLMSIPFPAYSLRTWFLLFFFTRSINSTYPAVLRQLIMYLGDLNASLFGPWYILNQCSLPVIFRLGSLLLHFAVYLRPLYQDILLWFSILRKCCML